MITACSLILSCWEKDFNNLEYVAELQINLCQDNIYPKSIYLVQQSF